MTRPIDVQARCFRFLMAVADNDDGPESSMFDDVGTEIGPALEASGKRDSEVIYTIIDECMKRLNWEG